MVVQTMEDAAGTARCARVGELTANDEGSPHSHFLEQLGEFWKHFPTTAYQQKECFELTFQ
jgi:hypothetical protein